MRNLKRALSLALASVMLMGIMVVGTGAASYGDVNTTHNQEAIEVMQGIGVMVGDTSGKFNPDSDVNRLEMAVVMTNLMGLKPADFSSVAIPFTDVPDWGRNYVAAMYANGIVAGTSKTTFGSTSTVTAAQAGLMMLKSLGYFQYSSDFGQDWQVATIKVAAKIDLYKGITTSATTALNRNNVAQLALNGLKADVVEVYGTPGTDITTPDGTNVNIGGNVKYESVVNGTHNYNFAPVGSESRANQQLAEKLYGNDLRLTASGSDSFGQPSSRWTYKAKEVGVYAKEATMTYTDSVKSSQIYADLGLSANRTVNVTVDGVGAGTFLIGKGLSTKTSTIGNVGTGTTVKVFHDIDADTIDIVAINTFVGEITNVYADASEPYVVVSGITGSGSGDFKTTGFEADEIVLYTYDGTNIQSLQKAEKVEGAAVTSFSTTKITAGGTSYTRNVQSVDKDAVSVDSTYDIYLDANGYAVYTKLFEGTTGNYAYVVSMNNLSNGFTQDTYRAQLVFADGTTKVVDTDNETDLTNSWVSYSMTDGVYTLYSRNTAAITGAGTISTTRGQTNIVVSGTGMGSRTFYANSATVMVVKTMNGTKATYTTYTGTANMPTITATTAGQAAKLAIFSNGTMAKYVFVEVADSLVSSDSSSMIFVTKGSEGSAVTDSNGTYRNYKALIDGEITTLKFSQDAAFDLVNSRTNLIIDGRLQQDLLLKSISYNSKGIVIRATAYTAGTDEAFVNSGVTTIGTGTTRYESGNVGLVGGGSTTYVTARDTAVVYRVNSDGDITKSSFESVRNDSNDTYRALTYKGQISALFITEVNITTPAVASVTRSGNVITVTLAGSNTIPGAQLSASSSITGGATISGFSSFGSGTGALTATATLSGTSGDTGSITVTVTNTVSGVGSASASFVYNYSI